MNSPTLTAPSRLSGHLQDLLAQKLRDGDSPTRIWLDSEGVYTGFVDKLAERGFFAEVVAFRGSYVETILALDGKGEGLDPEPLLVHLPGHTTESVRQTPLLEIYHAGLVFQKNLHTLVKEASVGLVAPERIQAEVSSLRTFEQAEEWLDQAVKGEADEGVAFDMAPDDFVYKLLSSPEKILGRALSSEDQMNLLNYWGLKTGMLPQIREALKVRYTDFQMQVLAWLLLMEYVFDLKRQPLGILAAVKEQRAFEAICKQCLSRVRDSFPADYCRTALELETWAPLAQDLLAGKADELGKIDTFSREDQRLFEEALVQLTQKHWQAPMAWTKQRLRSRSIWLKREPEREKAWRYVQACAELGQLCQLTSPSLAMCEDHQDALTAYTTQLHRVDRAHREVEQRYDGLHVHGDLGAINAARDCVRALYHEWSDKLSREFNNLCHRKGFLPDPELQQRNLYEDLVHPLVCQADKVAYLMIDALRYEMAVELQERLEGGDLSSQLQARLAELPTETRVGMNALAPVSKGGRLTLKKPFDGFTYDNFTVNSPKQRFRAMGHRSLASGRHDNKLPTHFTLKSLITEDSEVIADKVRKAKMIVVTSGEIDTAGEKDLGFSTFDDTLGKIASAVRVLHNAGVKNFVLASDHGFGVTNPAAHPISYYNGERTRRYVLMDAGASVCKDALTVPLKELSYQGVDKMLVLSWDGRNFDCPGKNAESFYHGGNSLQERVIPVLVLQYRDRGRRAERPEFKILAELVNEMPTLVVLSLAVKEGAKAKEQMMLVEAGEQKVRLLFEAVGPGSSLALSGTSSGVIENGQLIVSTECKVENVFLQLSGAPSAIRIMHPDGEYSIAPLEIPLKTSSELPKGSDSWEETVSDQVCVQVLKHIEKHGEISEDEIISLTDNIRAPRRFARACQSGEFAHLPFRLRIDTSQGTTYIKE